MASLFRKVTEILNVYKNRMNYSSKYDLKRHNPIYLCARVGKISFMFKDLLHL